MHNSYVDLILCFTSYAFLGWVLESAYKTFRDRRLVNSGFLSGPFIPIYGFGAVGVIQLLSFIEPAVNSVNPLAAIIIKLGAIIALVNLLEYSTGFLLETLFHRRWWDYSEERFNLQGLISLKYSLFWGGLCFFMLEIIQPRLEMISYLLPQNLKITVLVLLLIYLTLDLTRRLNSLGNWKSYFYNTMVNWINLNLWEDKNEVQLEDV